MSEPSKTVTPSFDVVALKAKLDKIAEEQKKDAGKPGKNPFLWIKQHVDPLLARLNKGEKTPELASAINSLKP